MIILMAFLYVVIGGIVTFALHYLQVKSGKRYCDDGFVPVMTGIFWPVAAPFTFALYLAEEMNRRK